MKDITHTVEVLPPQPDPLAPRNSKERIQDQCFEDLIKDWTAKGEFDWVEAAFRFYQHILEERALDLDERLRAAYEAATNE